MLEGRKWKRDGWRCSEQKREERKIKESESVVAKEKKLHITFVHFPQ